jgi:multidrug efflux pump
MIGPNLSEWATRSRALTVYLMLVAVVAGAFAFVNLGRDEDPSFTIKTMLVTAVWPGATIEETQRQLTDRLERTAPGDHGPRRAALDHPAGDRDDLRRSRRRFPPERGARCLAGGAQRIGDIRHTLPQGVLGPFFNDDFGDVFGIIYGFTADGFSDRELRDYVDVVRSRCCAQVDGIGKIEFIGVQDETIFVEFQPDRVAAMGLDYGQIFAAIAAQNVVRPSGTINSGQENLILRVTGAFETENDILEVSLIAGGRAIRLGDIATVRRGFVDPPQPLLHVNGERAIALGDLDARGRRHPGARRRTSTARWRGIVADLPIGIEPHLISNQPAVVTTPSATSPPRSIRPSPSSCRQLPDARRAPGAVVAVAIPVTLATVFLVMQTMGIDLHRVSLGALIIALALLVDDAMTTTDAILRRLAAGDTVAGRGLRLPRSPRRC